MQTTLFDKQEVEIGKHYFTALSLINMRKLVFIVTYFNMCFGASFSFIEVLYNF